MTPILASGQSGPPPGGRRRRIRPARLALYLAIYAAFLLALGELAARVYWMTRGLPFARAHAQLELAFYPELKPILESPIARTDEFFDILTLGGSVLTPECGNIPLALQEELTRRTRRPLRVFNAAQGAQTTLDSLVKYGRLADKGFDLVVVYHAINELRANNCLPETFRDDYSHYAWYRAVGLMERRARWPLLLPFTARLAAEGILERTGAIRTLPKHRPSYEAMAHGGDVKTAEPFRRNLEAILDLAAERGERVALVSFASYIPADYEEAKFWRRELDYTTHWFPVETWGAPDHVRKGLEIHNRILREIAARRPEAIYIDMDAAIPKEGRFFNDVCHLTDEGRLLWAQTASEAILPMIEGRSAGHGSPSAPKGG